MTSKLVYIDEQNKLNVVHPTADYMSSHTIEDLKILLNIPNAVIVEEEDIPSDRYFREAWELRQSTIDINLPKAQEVKLDNLRILRNNELQKMDIQYQIALEQNLPELQAIADKKQELRDMPTIIQSELENIEDLEILKAYVPDMLKD